MVKIYFVLLIILLTCQLIAKGDLLDIKSDNSYKKIISIDLDGVLDEYSGKYDKNSIPKIKEGADDFIKTLNKKYDLILFTTRNSKMAEKWLIENNLNKYFKTVTSKKQPCYLYIDDRAVKFNGDYKQTLKEIDNFEVYWKIKQ